MYDYYIKESQKLRNIGKDLNLTDADIDRVIDNSFKVNKNETTYIRHSQMNFGYRNKFIITTSLLVAVIIILYINTSQRKIVYGYIERNFQALVYPAMKLLRKIMLPVIKRFPSLTRNYFD